MHPRSIYGDKGKGKPMSEEEKAYIKKRHSEQAFNRQIAAELGRSLYPIKKYLKREGMI
jgi:IS30 family transposase